MRKGAKYLMTASMFAVVMNMNGCGAYGPPSEFFEPGWNMEQPAYGVPYYEVTPMPTTAPTEAEWYKLTKRNYAVIRITSVPEPVQDGKDAVQNVIYGIEVLAFYAADGADLSTVTMLSVPKKDSLVFDEGDIVFAELGQGIQQDDALIYPLIYDAYGPVYSGFSDGKLETAGFDNHKCSGGCGILTLTLSGTIL